MTGTSPADSNTKHKTVQRNETALRTCTTPALDSTVHIPSLTTHTACLHLHLTNEFDTLPFTLKRTLKRFFFLFFLPTHFDSKLLQPLKQTLSAYPLDTVSQIHSLLWRLSTGTHGHQFHKFDSQLKHVFHAWNLACNWMSETLFPRPRNNMAWYE